MPVPFLLPHTTPVLTVQQARELCTVRHGLQDALRPGTRTLAIRDSGRSEAPIFAALIIPGPHRPGNLIRHRRLIRAAAHRSVDGVRRPRPQDPSVPTAPDRSAMAALRDTKPKEIFHMEPLTESVIRKSFINASRSQAAAMNFPPDFADVDWQNLDQFGWQDHKMPKRSYLVLQIGNKPVAIMLRAPELVSASKKALCALCEDLESDDDVYLFVAPKAGPAGKNGDSVGTLIHSNFSCSRNVRTELKPTPIHPDPEAVKAERIRGLRERTRQFVEKVRS